MKHVSMAALAASTALAQPRAVQSFAPRADGEDPAKILGDLKKTFNDFMSENDTRLKALEKGKEDVVTNEKVEKINSAVGELQTAIDDMSKKLAAAQLHGGDPDPNATPERKAYSKAFDAFFRKGRDAEALGELAVKAAMSTQSDPDGGYLVPTEMESTIDRVLGSVSAVRSLATVRPISTGTYKKLINKAGTSSGWVTERQARAETNPPQLVELAYEAMELYAEPAATQTLLDDSVVDIGAWLADEVAIEFAEQEGAAFVSGTGVGKPKGILSYATAADSAALAFGKVGYVVSGLAAALAADPNGLDAFIALTYGLKQGYRNNASWLMNRFTAGIVRKLKDSQGHYQWEPSNKLGEPASLLGYPLADDDNMPDIAANAFPVAFADFKRAYVIVDRMGVRVLRDPYTSKPNVLFYTTKRVGGGIQKHEAIKLLKISV
jgi:HK97 family phage major capsid protein